MTSYPQRELGTSGLKVSAIGLGCMGMSEFYGPAEDDVSIQVIHRALDLGVNFLDTADMYGMGHNERLVGRALQGRRQQAVVATKFGNQRDNNGNYLGVNGRPEYLRQQCDTSLRNLGIETIDLYYQHRVDPNVPIEETIGAMAELVQEGKVRYLGMSEAAPETLRRAAAVHPVAALQTEYSLWSREPEDELLPTCRELGIGFVAYSPLGRGFLTGALKNPDELDAQDWRRSNPRFQGENLQQNVRLVETVERLAKERGVAASELALAWLLAQGKDVVPIPGTRRIKYLESNASAAQLALSSEELQALSAAIPPGAAAGARYPEAAMRSLNK